MLLTNYIKTALHMRKMGPRERLKEVVSRKNYHLRICRLRCCKYCAKPTAVPVQQ